MDYQVLISNASLEKAQFYLEQLKEGWPCGRYPQEALSDYDLNDVTLEEFLEILVNTKKPQIFAESAVMGDGTDWNFEELSILGDIAIATRVNVYDNGLHRAPDFHHPPFEGHLLFVPGALLRSHAGQPADWKECVTKVDINFEGYSALYERRLLPILKYASDESLRKGRKAFITIPGLGCGQFAGKFMGELGYWLNLALQKILENNHSELTGIKAVYFDPFRECANQWRQIGGIKYIVRPLTMGNEDRPQLCLPTDYEEDCDDFSDCDLYSVVAWDHVSWPGNDFFSGSRSTDDGVKAAATSSMTAMTGISGEYNETQFRYNPPDDYYCWREVVQRNELQISVVDNLRVY